MDLTLNEEQAAFRRAVKEWVDDVVVPRALQNDREERFPQEALDALNASGFNAVHIPEEYEGQGADSVAACIVIEEVARVDASSSLIPSRGVT